MENISYKKITLAVFVGVTSSSILIILLLLLLSSIAEKQAQEDLKRLFSKPVTYPSQTLEKRVQSRMEVIRPKIDRIQQIENEFRRYNSDICQKYYMVWWKQRTEDNLKVARQVCKNFG